MGSTKRSRTTTGATGRDVLDLTGYLPYFLTAISNTWSRSSSRLYLDRFGVGITEWRVVSQLAIEPGISAQRICEVIELDKGAVSRAVASLVAARQISEERDAQDSRRVLLTLTRSGEILHDQLIALALAREEVLLAGFSEGEKAQLLVLLRRLHGRLAAVRDFVPGPAVVDSVPRKA